MERAESPGVREARTRITQLQQSVQGVMDGDRVLPADGSSLLAMLDQALEELADEEAPAVPPLGTGSRAVGGAEREPWTGIEAFIGRVQALIQAGVLDVADGRPWIEAAAAIGALLPSAGGTDAEPLWARMPGG
jgi:hypothetical protein